MSCTNTDTRSLNFNLQLPAQHATDLTGTVKSIHQIDRRIARVASLPNLSTNGSIRKLSKKIKKIHPVVASLSERSKAASPKKCCLARSPLSFLSQDLESQPKSLDNENGTHNHIEASQNSESQSDSISFGNVAYSYTSFALNYFYDRPDVNNSLRGWMGQRLRSNSI